MERSEETHDRYVHRLANLTLSGYNPEMGAAQFHQKRQVYEESAVGMTRRLANENEWNEDALERRAEDLAVRVLRRWPWPDQGVEQSDSPPGQAPLRWRIEDGPWHPEQAASQMVLNVAGALLSRDPENAQKLSGDSISNNLQSASQYPPDTAAGTLTMRAVPGHDQYVLYPYDRDYPTSAERCRKMGQRCSARIEVEFQENVLTPAFWRLLAHVGGVPGQKENWRGATQWTSPLNSMSDAIGIYVGNPDRLWLYIRAGQSQPSEDRAARMRKYSWEIREQMSDQVLGENLESEHNAGRTVAVMRPWTREDEDEWPEAAKWIVEQCERLQSIMTTPLDPTATLLHARHGYLPIEGDRSIGGGTSRDRLNSTTRSATTGQLAAGAPERTNCPSAWGWPRRLGPRRVPRLLMGRRDDRSDLRPTVGALADHYHARYRTVLDFQAKAETTAECYVHLREFLTARIDEACTEHGATSLLTGLDDLIQHLTTAHADPRDAIDACQRLAEL